MKIEIAPSILSVDFGKLNEEIATVEAFADRLHVDVMDGNFVPNISFGAPVYKWIKSKLPLDVHLMIEHPWDFFDDFIEAGGRTLIVHSEACPDLRGVLGLIKERGALPAVSIKPATPVSDIKDVLDLVDQVLVMTVEPGFGGQAFMEDMVKKIGELKELGFKGNIGVDGGINEKTAKICVEAGANILIAGNYIFGAKDREEAIKRLKE